MTLTEFLLARIAEDEAGAQAAATYSAEWAVADEFNETVLLAASDEYGHTFDSTYGQIAPHIARHDPVRVLAECEAKRRIVGLMGYVRESWENGTRGRGRVMWPDVNRREKMHALTILENLATVYADHPDYRDEWRV